MGYTRKKQMSLTLFFSLQNIEKRWFHKTRGSLKLQFFPKDGLFHKTLASVHNLRVLLIFFDFILFVSLILAIFWHWDPFEKNVVLQEKVSCTRGNFHSPSIQLSVS